MNNKKETLIINISLILNFIVACIKLLTGLLFNFSSLIADSFQSFADFITDIISKMANLLSKKRATKKYPFGYGMIEYIVNLIIGITLFVLDLFIFIRSFSVHEVKINYYLYIILLIIIVLKFIVVRMLINNGKKLKSNILLTSAKESNADLISTIIVFIISFILLFQDKLYYLKYIDVVGSMIISLLIFKIAFTIIIENIHSLLGENDNNEEIIENLNKILKKYSDISEFKNKLIKNGNYYILYLSLELKNDNITVKKLIELERKVKKDIKNHIPKIKFINFDITNF